MTDAVRKHTAGYAAFAVRMLAAYAAECEWAERFVPAKHVAATTTEEQTAATVRPSK